MTTLQNKLDMNFSYKVKFIYVGGQGKAIIYHAKTEDVIYEEVLATDLTEFDEMIRKITGTVYNIRYNPYY
jgi:hypothetical protein